MISHIAKILQNLVYIKAFQLSSETVQVKELKQTVYFKKVYNVTFV